MSNQFPSVYILASEVVTCVKQLSFRYYKSQNCQTEKQGVQYQRRLLKMKSSSMFK